MSYIENIKFYILFISRKIKNIIGVLNFPNVDYLQARKVSKLAEKIYKEHNYDYIMSVFRPYSAVAAGIYMKRKYPEIISVANYLDLISGANKPKIISESLYKKMCIRGDVNTFSELDAIIMAKGGENVYKDDTYKKVNDKLTYVDFPVFTVKESKKNYIKKNSRLHFMYAGTLDKEYRSPEYMLNILDLISNDIENITLDIYGRGNCADIINEFKDKAKFKIVEHGMVPHEEIVSAMMASDFLINISNKTQNIVPSKIFELFSIGKPIVNFISNPDDITKEYFDKYPCVRNINQWEEPSKYYDKLQSFIKSETGKQYNLSEIREKYFENTPEYFANIFESIIE